MRHVFCLVPAVLLLAPGISSAQPAFTAHDNYTRYELLAPGSGQFAITYYVTERRAGAIYLLNQTRSGSAGSDIAVFDPQTGRPLKFDYMTGAELTADKTPGRFDPNEHYIRAHLPRPVPEGGEGRVKILKTYRDEKSYYVEGEDLVFRRSLGIARNSIVLPKGYRLLSSNVAAQMFTLPDGRFAISYEHAHGYAADVMIRARPSASAGREADIPVERAFDWSKTVYELQFDPQAVTVTHEYVETTAGEEVALQRPAGMSDEVVVTDLDSGQSLPVSMRGSQAIARLRTPVSGAGASARLRISGVMRDTGFRMREGAMDWTTTTGAARTLVILPAGWDVASVSIPATVTAQSDGRVGIQIYNGSAGAITVTIRAAKR